MTANRSASRCLVVVAILALGGCGRPYVNIPSLDGSLTSSDTLFLTWFDDPTTTMVIQWLAPGGGTAPPPVKRITYWWDGLGPGETRPTVWTTVRPFGDSSFFVHRAQLSDLTPDTTYRFRVDAPTQAAQQVFMFKTAPQELLEPLIFAEGGDVGVSPQVALLHQQAAAWKPLFALVGGDCAYGDGRKPLKWVAYLRLWNANMRTEDGRLIPMICAIGNHEVDGGWRKTREEAPYFLALFDGLYPQHSFATLDFGDYLSLFLLDSGHITPHDGEQLAWLGEAMEQPTRQVVLGPLDRAMNNHGCNHLQGSAAGVAGLRWVVDDPYQGSFVIALLVVSTEKSSNVRRSSTSVAAAAGRESCGDTVAVAHLEPAALGLIGAVAHGARIIQDRHPRPPPMAPPAQRPTQATTR